MLYSVEKTKGKKAGTKVILSKVNPNIISAHNPPRKYTTLSVGGW
jgi:hypothetical protein